ncbi:Uma2 family endonuclease [Rhodoplanes sp. TEM]|uniref:Uma2 family endonuclease n=1 Tax=Rhodoplanes tepidamans TaxID=200616 RepID=A0ABT5JHU8_RHOTP|nr:MULTISPECIES: Uma2 family endonuclease [Rhodoplanes]MDC7788946.1 Uma2 family endonuclease [Rhodoplanes tepidamans]MDC7987231.1 Uma2 family endonuclease [Rhodoplanes sp. TEM]MDQ0358640.1 Uma2 family endonuclease [Rhodoplanes tepidamans]
MTVAVTRGAEGFPRRAFTVDDIRLMIEVGLIGPEENFELIEGEIVPMRAKSVAHDRVKNSLNLALARAVGPGLYVGIEATVQLARDVLVEPDLCVIAQSVYDADPKSFAQPRAEDVRLLIEVAVSSTAYDRKVKARLYARHGIREYWVIDAAERVTVVHTGPAGDGWASVVTRPAEAMLACAAVPGFAFRLADLG